MVPSHCLPAHWPQSVNLRPLPAHLVFAGWLVAGSVLFYDIFAGVLQFTRILSSVLCIAPTFSSFWFMCETETRCVRVCMGVCVCL